IGDVRPQCDEPRAGASRRHRFLQCDDVAAATERDERVGPHNVAGAVDDEPLYVRAGEAACRHDEPPDSDPAVEHRHVPELHPTPPLGPWPGDPPCPDAPPGARTAGRPPPPPPQPPPRGGPPPGRPGAPPPARAPRERETVPPPPPLDAPSRGGVYCRTPEKV